MPRFWRTVAAVGAALLLVSLEAPALAVEPLAHLALLAAAFAIARAASPHVPPSWIAGGLAVAAAAVAVHALSQQWGGLARLPGRAGVRARRPSRA